MGNDNPEKRGQTKPGANWSLEDTTEFIEHCFDRDTILDVLQGYSAYWFPARLTLIVGREWVQLFAADGWELDRTLPRSARRADVDADAPAVSKRVTTGTPDEVGLGQLFEQLDIGRPIVRTVGIPIGERIAIVLVGSVRNDTVDTSELQTLADVAGTQLEDVIRRAKADALPPPDERIPEFPEPQVADQAVPGRDVRHTQQLDSSPNPSRTLNAPRLAATGDSEGEEDDASPANPSATSFGLPFANEKEKDGQEPPSEVSEAADASESSAGDEDSDVIGSPFTEDKFPGDLGEESSGVTAVPPQGLGGSSSERTQLGGITAEPNIVTQQKAEQDFAREDSSAPEESSDVEPNRHEKITPAGFSPADAPDSSKTQLGGMAGDAALVNEAISRQDDDETRVPGGDSKKAPSAETEETTDEEPWETARSDSGVPKAMILKPARTSKKKQVPGARSERETKRVTRAPKPGREPKVTPQARRPSSDAGDDDAAPAIGSESDDASDQSGDISTSGTSETMFGGGWTSDEDSQKFEIEDEVDDAWFDYFADVAEDDQDDDSMPDSEEALNFSLSEPSEDDPNSLPPETLERLLDSGPAMVDMQEQFLILDSRDRRRAMDAAEEVADMGDTALEVLELMFPGRIFLDRYQYSDDLPEVSEHGPVLHALVRIGDQAVDVARKHMTDASNETRFYAVFLLTKINAEPALAELYPRLFDKDQQIRTTASEIIQGYTDSPDFDELIRTRLHGELLADDLHVKVAAGLSGALKDVEAIVPLIDALEEASASGVQAAIMSALRQITLHDWSAPFEWRQWWVSARDESREDWIVEALDASSESIRQLVYDEIQRIPGLELNYHPDQPSKLRRRAQKQLREWYDAL